MKLKTVMKFLTMNTFKCMSLEQNPAFSTVYPRFTQFYLPSEQLAIAIATFFVPLLSAFTTNHFSIKDSFSFATEICSLHDSNSYFMASFDIKSLFTNIPLEETVSIATENYF